MIDPSLLERLHALLGHQCLHEGQSWRVIDVLPVEGILVLESGSVQPGIQLDQFGRASHRAPEIRQIRILGADGKGLSEELQALLDCLGDCRPT